MAKMNYVKSSGMGLPGVMRALKSMERDAVSVGVHESAGNHKDEDGQDSGATVAEIAAFNEYGTPTIPERPALRQAIEQNRKKYFGQLNRILGRIIENPTMSRNLMGKIGTVVQNDMQKSIVELSSPPNSDSTIAAKNSSNPLIDTGQYVNSVRWEYLNKPVEDDRND